MNSGISSKKKLIIALVSSLLLLCVVVGTIATVVFLSDDGFAYWDFSSGASGTPLASEDLDVLSHSAQGSTIFNPSAKYFTYNLYTEADPSGTAVPIAHTMVLTKDEVRLLVADQTQTTAESINAITITGYTGNVTSIKIPDEFTIYYGTSGSMTKSIKTVPVVAVSGISSSNTVSLTSIYIPASVKSIASGCFSGYRATLKKLAFETRTTMLTIGSVAFARSVTTAGCDVYYGDTEMTNKAALTATTYCTIGTGAFLGWA